MAWDYWTVIPERPKVVYVVNGVESAEVEYELATDESDMVFRRPVGKTTDADWEPCYNNIAHVRRLMAGGGTLPSILGKEWEVIVPPDGGVWRAYDSIPLH